MCSKLLGILHGEVWQGPEIDHWMLKKVCMLWLVCLLPYDLKKMWCILCCFCFFDVFLPHALCETCAKFRETGAKFRETGAKKKKVHQMGHEIGHFCVCVGSFWLDSVGGWCLLIHWPVVWACLGLLLLLQWKKLTYNNKLRQDIQGTI